MYCVYILYSKKLNRFYTGTTDDFANRFAEHNEETKPDSFTLRGRPWVLFLKMEGLNSDQAYKIEEHIKKMKSSVFIKNLQKHPELFEKLKNKYR